MFRDGTLYPVITANDHSSVLLCHPPKSLLVDDVLISGGQGREDRDGSVSYSLRTENRPLSYVPCLNDIYQYWLNIV